jgi:hypothetical protein
MKRKVSLLALVGACASILAVAAPAAAPPGPPTITLHFFDITSRSAATSPNERPKLGDRFWFEDQLYRWNGAKRGAHAGHVEGTAVVLGGPPPIAVLSATAFVPGATLDIQGVTSFTSTTNTYAVIGGTGAFATARGEVIVRTLGNPQNSNRNAVTVRLWM